MIRARHLLLLSAAIVLACNNADLGAGPEDQPETVDLLIIPPDGTEWPAQIVPDQTFNPLHDPEHDLQLKTGRLFQGIVTSNGAAALEGMTVRITMQGAGIDKTQESDALGVISMPLGPAVYDIEVTPLPIPAHYGFAPRVFRNVTIPGDSGDEFPFELPMTPGYAIRGAVLDGGGPLEGWRVSARNEAGDPSTWAVTTLAGFEIFVATTGGWTVQITPPAGEPKPIALKTIEVDGDGTDLPFIYENFAIRTISGQVTGLGPSEPPPSAAGITVRARATLPSADPTVTYTFDQRTTTDAQGAFTLDVLAGTYTLTIEPPVDSVLSHRVITTIDATAADVTVDPAQTQLFPKVELTGRVLSEETSQGTAGARVALVAADGTSYSFTDRSASGGTYGMELDLGLYSALVLPAGDSSLVRHVQSVEVTEETANVDFTLESGFLVGGRVFSPLGEPVANVTVMALRSSDKAPVGSSEWLTEDDGRWFLTLPFVP